MKLPALRPRLFAACALAALLAAPAHAVQIEDGDVPRDAHKNRWFHWETSPVATLACSADARRLYAANQPGARIAVYDLQTRKRVHEIPVGPGVVAIALRPGSSELWAVDSITSAVSVIDTLSQRIVATVRVGAGAHGIAFTPGGDRAYVSCSTAERVDVVRARDRVVVQSIDVPAREPRGIQCTGDEVRVVAFQSGNGTAPRGNPSGWVDDVTEVRHVQELAGHQPLPDRDLFTIRIGATPGTDWLDASRTVTALGTTLYNLHARPGVGELWVPHTDALNGTIVGERNFAAGQVVRNRIALVSGAGTSFVDLDLLTATEAERCATPTSVAFTADGQRAFVTGYGSDTIAVLDCSGTTPKLHGMLRVTPARNYPDGAGPRVAIVTPNDRWLVVSNKGDNTLSWLALADLPSARGYDLPLEPSESLGWDPLPLNLKQGRIHFRRTQNSLSGTSSCDSCHVDGHTDGLAWDLSQFLDPEGTPREALHLPLDRKGPMVTQSVRALREVGPYHWRGDRRRLRDFNAVFTDMLERHENGELDDLGGDMVYIEEYMDFLAPRPNPRQAPDRRYTAEQLAGAHLYLNEPVQGSLRCASCHPLPLATSGELAINHLGGLAPTSEIPSLRGVAEKLAPPFTIGGSFGTRTELGAGLNHAGNASSIADVLLAEKPPPQGGRVFDLTGQEAQKIRRFLEALDTGIAPAAVFQATATPANAATFLASELALVIEQARAGNCDVAATWGPAPWLGADVYFGALYDPDADRFRPASQSLPPMTASEVIALAAGGTPVTFLGYPPWGGRAAAMDRDLDGMLDLDERALGTGTERADTDGDGYPDGYEVVWGMDPLVDDHGSPDASPPAIVGGVKTVWATTRAARVEFVVNEPVRALFSYDGGYPVLRWPLAPDYDTHFSVVLTELEPGRDTQVTVHMTDPSGNVHAHHVAVSTAERALALPVRVDDIDMALVPDAQGRLDVRVRVRLRRGDGPPAVGYNVRANLYYESPSAGPSLVAAIQTWLVRPDGIVEIVRDVPDSMRPGSGSLVFAIQGIDAPPGRPPHARGADVEQRATLEL